MSSDWVQYPFLVNLADEISPDWRVGPVAESLGSNTIWANSPAFAQCMRVGHHVADVDRGLPVPVRSPGQYER